MLADVILALLLESHVQIIELVSVILALSMELMVGIIFAYPFEDGLTWVCSSWGIKEVILPCKIYAIRNIGSYLKSRGMPMLK